MSAGRVGSLLPTPVDGADPTITALKADIRSLRGKVALVESTSSGWAADGVQQRPQGDWQARRLGAAPGAPLIEQAELRQPGSFCSLRCSVEHRHHVRRNRTTRRFPALASLTIMPLAKIVSEELTDKFESPISLSFDALFAADLAGRARAFQSLVGGGMDVAKAASLAGLMQAED